MLVIADQCDSNPCQNNSICVGGKCECLPGYSGENCKEGTFVIIKRINEWENLDLFFMACRILRYVYIYIYIYIYICIRDEYIYIYVCVYIYIYKTPNFKIFEFKNKYQVYIPVLFIYTYIYIYIYI